VLGWLWEIDFDADSDADCVGEADEPESEAGPDAVGKALSVETVKVGRACAVTLVTPIVVRVARRKRTDGDMRRDTMVRMVQDDFTLENVLERGRRSGSNQGLVTPPAMRNREMVSCRFVCFGKTFVREELKTRPPPCLLVTRCTTPMMRFRSEFDAT
jgi:hypothetical protein